MSPDSDGSSGADRIMWHKRGLGMTRGENGGNGGDEGDTRSSSSSLGWMMKGPLNGSGERKPTVGEGEGSSVVHQVQGGMDGESMKREPSAQTVGSDRTGGTIPMQP